MYDAFSIPHNPGVCYTWHYSIAGLSGWGGIDSLQVVHGFSGTGISAVHLVTADRDAPSRVAIIWREMP